MITDSWGRILQGARATTVGHQMNRGSWARPDVNAVIHLHHDEMIAFMACATTRSSFSLTYGYLMEAGLLPAGQRQRRGGCGPIKEFIAGTTASS